MALLTKAQILEADDVLAEVVKVPEWGGEVKVQGITAKARDQWEVTIAEQKEKNRPIDVRASLCAKSIVDEDGKRMFTDKEIDVLGKRSAVALERVFTVAMKVSGLSQGDVEELEGN